MPNAPKFGVKVFEFASNVFVKVASSYQLTATELPKLANKITLDPTQVFPPLLFTKFGVLKIDTCVVAVFVQLLLSKTVTVYMPDIPDVILVNAGFWIVEVKDSGPDQL